MMLKALNKEIVSQGALRRCHLLNTNEEGIGWVGYFTGNMCRIDESKHSIYMHIFLKYRCFRMYRFAIIYLTARKYTDLMKAEFFNELRYNRDVMIVEDKGIIIEVQDLGNKPSFIAIRWNSKNVNRRYAVKKRCWTLALAAKFLDSKAILKGKGDEYRLENFEYILLTNHSLKR